MPATGPVKQPGMRSRVTLGWYLLNAIPAGDDP
ncbi:hypothetical protein BC793_101289 [Actinoplanes xinjiangensis]|uniref:Uncharacterized protein n=1 Tax=Actinoplanes xinjiangensis TaxID=512350 RepID=A0A316FXL6_9ACTN|nr:hypothetical protein BC793_101289 [Actinoplanes xinjiangensis]